MRNRRDSHEICYLCEGRKGEIVKIVFDGSEKSILEIIDNLPDDHGKAIIARGNSIQLATDEGAKQVWIGDSVVIEGDSVKVIEN